MKILGGTSRSLLRPQLKLVAHVRSTSILPDEDRVEIEVQPDQQVALEEIETVTQRLGFFPGYWGIFAKGELVAWNGAPGLNLKKHKVKLLLACSKEEVEQRLRSSQSEQTEPSKIAVSGALQTVSDPTSQEKVVKLWVDTFKNDP